MYERISKPIFSVLQSIHVHIGLFVRLSQVFQCAGGEFADRVRQEISWGTRGEKVVSLYLSGFAGDHNLFSVKVFLSC